MIEIGYERRDRIAYITLNRPEAKNAITPEMHEELCRIWADFRDDDDADVAILTGTGDAFCAGADLATYVPSQLRRRLAEPGSRDRRPRLRWHHPGTAPNHEADDRGRQWVGSSRRPRARAGLRSAGGVSNVRCSARSRRDGGSTTVTEESRGWSTHAASEWRCKWSSPPSRSTRSRRCNATW